MSINNNLYAYTSRTTYNLNGQERYSKSESSDLYIYDENKNSIYQIFANTFGEVIGMLGYFLRNEKYQKVSMHDHTAAAIKAICPSFNEKKKEGYVNEYEPSQETKRNIVNFMKENNLMPTNYGALI